MSTLENMIDKFNSNIKKISAQEYFVALAAVFVVLGSKDLVVEMTEHVQPTLKYPFVKKLTLFFIIFIYTKDVISSLMATGFLMILFPKVFFKDPDCESDSDVDSEDD